MMPAQCVPWPLSSIGSDGVVIGVEAVEVVDRAKLVVGVLRHILGPDPHIRDEVLMRVIDAAVEHRDNNVLAALRFLPSLESVDIGALLTAVPAVDCSAPTVRRTAGHSEHYRRVRGTRGPARTAARSGSSRLI